jgi:aminopeptidase N
MITKYQMAQPIALAVFALGPFQRVSQKLTMETTGTPIALEFNSVPARVAAVKDDFILAELGNAVRYFASMFGAYPYPTFGAAFHPYPFGQGFPTLLMIPPTDVAAHGVYAFLAHETAHQWWGNIVAWRSYRDQWLSEGFAEYSGAMYAERRDEKKDAAVTFLKQMRESLLNPPRTGLGVGRGRLNDIGPIILGARLNSSQSVGAYQALIYNKGALVLRMLHFLLTNPNTGDDRAFTAMMTDFVERHRNGTASTDDFRKVAGEHFAKSPIAQKFGLKDLDWFFYQWVNRTELPSYQLEYELKSQPDGSILASGTIRQDNVPADWFMPLPILFTFDNNQTARPVVRAAGASTTFELKLPAKPKKVELDPTNWILSEKTSSKAK